MPTTPYRASSNPHHVLAERTISDNAIANNVKRPDTNGAATFDNVIIDEITVVKFTDLPLAKSHGTSLVEGLIVIKFTTVKQHGLVFVTVHRAPVFVPRPKRIAFHVSRIFTENTADKTHISTSVQKYCAPALPYPVLQQVTPVKQDLPAVTTNNRCTFFVLRVLESIVCKHTVSKFHSVAGVPFDTGLFAIAELTTIKTHVAALRINFRCSAVEGDVKEVNVCK